MLNKKVNITVRYIDPKADSDQTEYFIIPELSKRFTEFQLIPSVKEKIMIDPPMLMKSIDENDEVEYEASGSLKVAEVTYGVSTLLKGLEVIIDTKDYYASLTEIN